MTNEELIEGVADVIRHELEKSTVRGSKYNNAAQAVINYLTPMMREVAGSQRAAIKFMLATYKGDASSNICEKLADSLASLPECWLQQVQSQT